MKKERRIVILLIILILGIISLFFDKQISMFFYGLQNPILNSILGASVYFQIPGIFMGLLILILAVIFFLKKEKIEWIFHIIGAFIFTSGIVFLLKEIVGRARPYIALGLEEPPLHAIGESFPSAHAAVVFSMLPFFEKEYPKLKYAWIVFAIVICFIRIYFPVHYLSDILFGSLIGYIIGYVFCNWKIKRKRKKMKRKKR
jgi:undecaprenyl-diphosphatase